MRAVRADSIQGEAAFLPSDLEDLITLRRRIIDELGESPATASGIVGWLAAKTAGERDETGQPTRARYRKILAQLDPPRIHVPPSRRVLSSSGALAA